MGFLIPLIYFLLSTFVLTNIFKEKFLKCLPITFIISSLVLFLSQMVFHTFYVGIISCLLFSLSFIPYLIIKKKNIKDYFTKDVWAFIIIYLLIFIVDFNRSFYKWDELSHWGKMVKEMFRLDSFYSVFESNLLVHKDYPPIMSIMEYFYAFISGGYKEAYLIRCLHLFSSSLILSTITYDKEKNKWLIIKTLLAFIISFLLIELFDQSFIFNTIYIDITLSLLVAYILYNIYTHEEYDRKFLILLSIVLSFLLLFKQVAISFFFLILFFFILMCFDKKKKVDYKYLIFLIIPICFYIMWSLYVKSLDIQGQFVISDIMVNLKNSLVEYQKTTISNYFTNILKYNLINSFISITYIHFIVLIPLLFILLFKAKKDKVKNNKLMITLELGLIGYLILMLILYVFSFSEYEALELASFDRYMNTYSLIVVFTILFIKFDSFLIEKYTKKIIIFVLSLLLIITPISFIYIRPYLMIFNNSSYNEYKKSATYIDDKVDLNSKVFIIDQVEAHGSTFFITYYSNKIKTNEQNLKFDNNLDEFEFNELYYDILKEYDYAYTFMLDDEFINNYSYLNDHLEEKKLYKIILDKNKITLELKD